jgi:hypothetical protein
VALFSLIVLFLMMPETAGRNLLLEHDAVQDRRMAALNPEQEPSHG